ncbi:MAG: InlB B-repeat-containing protein [Bacilli bacterium]|nr:InlB B-repeat-containing protein [Bacilli bacterium]
MNNKIFQILLVGSSFFSISATSAINEVSTHKVHFVGTHCKINGESEFNDIVISGKTDLKYTIQADATYLMPTKDDIDCGGIDFEYSRGIISFPDPITQDIEITAECTKTYQEEYDFKFIGTDCTINGETNYNSKIHYLKENVKFTIVPAADKKVSLIKVTKGEDIVDVDETNNIITISSMTEDVEISATAISENQISFKGIGCTAKGYDQDSDMFILTGDIGSPYSFTLTPNDGLTLPEDIKVKIGDKIGVKGTDYQYTLNDDGTYTLSFKLKDATSIQASAGKFLTVDFDSNEGSAVESITGIQIGATISAPSNPTKDGYVFNGWYLDDETFKNKFNFTKTHVSSSFTLYAKWIENSNKVTITLDAGRSGFIETTDGDRYYSFEVEKGATWGDLEERLIGGAKPMNDFLYWTINGAMIAEDAVINDAVELEAVYAPTSEEYLTFTPRNDNATLIINEGSRDLRYKISSSDNWVNVTEETKNVTVNRGVRIFVKGNNVSYDFKNVFDSNESSDFETSGLCKSILPSGVFSDYSFECVFKDFKNLVSSYNLLLPDTTLVNYCYSQMFYGCASLTQAPTLPATTLAHSCYSQMFQGCTSLAQAPTLPATTLANSCYMSMFDGCTSLTQAPTLPATTLANYCYSQMFRGCASLTQAPTLPATTLVDRCYYSMFYGCTSLTQAPTLPATTLADSCCSQMFQGCTSLAQAPTLPATILAKDCYNSMFQGCTSLAQAPTLPATTLADFCYYDMFYGCTSLNVSEKEGNTLIFECPSQIPEDAVHRMFNGTGGSFDGTPTAGNKYYYN